MPRTRSPPAGTSAADMIAVLGELVAKSLVTVEFHGASARYRLTESTRAYALEKLHNEGEFERIAARHARYEREHGHAAASADAARRDDGGAEAPNDASAYAVTGAPNDVTADAVTAAPNDAPADPSTDAPVRRRRNARARSGTAARALLEPARMHECARGRAVLDAFDTAAADPVDAAREMRLRAACASALHTDGDAAAAAMWDRTLGLAARWRRYVRCARAGRQWHTMLTLSDIHESLRYATRFERAAERRGDRSQRLYQRDGRNVAALLRRARAGARAARGGDGRTVGGRAAVRRQRSAST